MTAISVAAVFILGLVIGLLLYETAGKKVFLQKYCTLSSVCL